MNTDSKALVFAPDRPTLRDRPLATG